MDNQDIAPLELEVPNTQRLSSAQSRTKSGSKSKRPTSSPVTESRRAENVTVSRISEVSRNTQRLDLPKKVLNLTIATEEAVKPASRLALPSITPNNGQSGGSLDVSALNSDGKQGFASRKLTTIDDLLELVQGQLLMNPGQRTTNPQQNGLGNFGTMAVNRSGQSFYTSKALAHKKSGQSVAPFLAGNSPFYSTMMSMHRHSGATVAGQTNQWSNQWASESVSAPSAKLRRCRQIQSKMNIPNIEERLTPMRHPVPTGVDFTEPSMRLQVARTRKTSPRAISLTPLGKKQSPTSQEQHQLLPDLKKQDPAILKIQSQAATKIKGLMQDASLTQHNDKVDNAISTLNKQRNTFLRKVGATDDRLNAAIKAMPSTVYYGKQTDKKELFPKKLCLTAILQPSESFKRIQAIRAKEQDAENRIKARARSMIQAETPKAKTKKKSDKEPEKTLEEEMTENLVQEFQSVKGDRQRLLARAQGASPRKYAPGKPGKKACGIVQDMVQATNPYVPPQPVAAHVERLVSARKRQTDVEHRRAFPSKFQLVAKPLEPE